MLVRTLAISIEVCGCMQSKALVLHLIAKLLLHSPMLHSWVLYAVKRDVNFY